MEQEIYANLLTKLTPEERVILDLRQQVFEAKKQVEIVVAKSQADQAKSECKILQVRLDATEKALEQANVNLLTKLTPEERVILDLRQQVLETKKQVEIVVAKSQADQTKSECKQVLEAKKQVEIVVAKSQVDQAKSECKILQVRLDAREKALAQLNWEKLEKEDHVELHAFIDYYDRNYLNSTINRRKLRFASFVKNYPNAMEKWDLSQAWVEKWFSFFYNKLNNSAYPIFQARRMFSITKGALPLEPMEIKLIALLWEVAPLPNENLYIEQDMVKHNLFEFIENKMI